MPFRPSPYGTPANPVIPLDYNLESQGLAAPSNQNYGGEHSPGSQSLIPSGQSDHNSVRPTFRLTKRLINVLTRPELILRTSGYLARGQIADVPP